MKKFLKTRPSDAPTTNDDALSALSSGPSSPGLKKPSASRWKKNKKQPETKPQLDLSAALPSTDEFRTSLIMPSLSTRFSMLREQDDPKSLLGKASDDSVLQPRRKSRMADFGFGGNGLSDIAEVSSIHGSIRPPFVQPSRGHSFVSTEDGYGSEADGAPVNVMSRSRPGEGNNLFGGRQKIYKIPTSGANSTRSLGKLMYEDDVGMSAFQKYRQREREIDESHFPRASDESQAFDFGLDQAEPGCQDGSGLDTLQNDSAKDLSHSPSLSLYDKKRSTSSTAHSDARSSTAATSVASQPTTSAQPSPAMAPVGIVPGSLNTAAFAQPTPASTPLDRANPKTRRLYEQGLDQHMHEQQHSAITRLNSIQRQRALSGKKSPPVLHNARSVGNLQDRAPQPVYALNSRSSPGSSPLPQVNTFGSIRRAHSGSPSPVLGGPHSPVDADDNDVLSQAIEPGDRGKATAMGAFNKPAHAFDEKQYMERQQALQRSNSKAVVPNKASAPAADSARASPVLSSSRDRSNSAPKKSEPSKAYNVFQNAVNQFPAKPAAPSQVSKSPLPDPHRTFFGNISASEDEDDEDDSSFSLYEQSYNPYPARWQPTQLQTVSEHPALRSQKSFASFKEEQEESKSYPLQHAASSRSLRGDAAHASALDSPTLPAHTQALNGMVHHLRQKSNQSSLYPNDEMVPDDDVPEVPDVPWSAKRSDTFSQYISSAMDNQSARESAYAISNPWDLDEQSHAAHSKADQEIVSPVDEASGANIPLNHESGISPVQETSTARARQPIGRGGPEISMAQQGDVSSWQQELRKQHNREASSATQQERDAFANELAARRNAIQENIKSIVERDTHSRGTSPAPAAGGSLRAFGIMRSKTSRESLAHGPDPSSKAARVLGSVSGNSSSTNLAGQSDRIGHSLETSRPYIDTNVRPPLPTAQHPAFKADGPGSAQNMDGGIAERILASSRSRTTSANRARSRSNSTTTTGRSRSRTGPYRDDLEKAMVEGHGTTATAHTPDMSPFSGASPDVSRLSDEDKIAITNYFDPKNSARLASNGSGPVTLSPNVYLPGRPVPVANPYSQNATPPLSTTSSPTIGSQPYTPIVPSSARPGGVLRKKTISKHEISEPTLISSTSNVDTVDLPEGASLKNGVDEPPPIPPINPKRRTTRKIFGRDRSHSRTNGDYEPKATASDTVLDAFNTSPPGAFQFPPTNMVRMPTVSSNRDYDKSPAVQQYGFSSSGSPERAPAPPGPQRAMTSPLEGAMF